MVCADWTTASQSGGATGILISNMARYNRIYMRYAKEERHKKYHLTYLLRDMI